MRQSLFFILFFIPCLSLCFVAVSWADEIKDSTQALKQSSATGSPSTVEQPQIAKLTQADDSDDSTPRKGWSMALGVAFATCIPNGRADCNNTFPGGSVVTALEKRFWYLGVALEFDYGFHFIGGTGSESVSTTTMHAVPMLKAYYPLENWEFFLGGGLGYSSISVVEDRSESSAHWSTLWQGLKVATGAWYDLHSVGMPEGFTLDLAVQYLGNFGGTRCTAYAGSEACLSKQDLSSAQRDVIHNLQVMSALRYTF